MADPKAKVAWEFDGPTHYVHGSNGVAPRLNGPSLFKQRILKKMGWKVHHIPYYEWGKLASRSDKEMYLKNRLIDERTEQLEVT